MPLTTFYGSTQDGDCTAVGGVNIADATMKSGAGSSAGQDVDTGEYHSFMFFNTGAVFSGIASEVTIYSAQLIMRLTGPDASSAISPLNFYIADNAIGSALGIEDYGDVKAVGVIAAAPSGKALLLAGTKTYNLGAAAIAQISLTGYTNFETDPVWGGGITTPTYIYFATQDNATESYRPRLVVNWDIPGIKNATLKNAILINS